MKQYVSNFGKRLKQLREKNHLTQQELANFLQVGRPTVAGYETKGKEPDFEKLCLLASYFKVSIDYLLGFSDYLDIGQKKVQLTTNPVTELETVERITSIARQLNVPFSELNDALSCKYDKINQWIKGNAEPTKEELQIIANYLKVPIELFTGQYKGCEPYTTFMDRLEYLMRVDQISEVKLCSALGISKNIFLAWKNGTDTSYTSYFKELSLFFHVSEKYFIFDNIIAPGIEPTEEEYFLLLLYRAYKNGTDIEIYNKLYDFFPEDALKDNNEKKLVETFRKLNENNKIRGISRLLDLEQEESQKSFLSVAADEKRNQKTGTDTLGKSYPSNGTEG